jgi:uncharacterized repeat protein (TIGR01451 family)
MIFISHNTSASENPSTRLVFSAADNAFKVEITGADKGEVSLFYRDSNGMIDGLTGSTDSSLSNGTCSSGTCMQDDVTHGIIKVYVEKHRWLKVARFTMSNGAPDVQFEQEFTDIDPSLINPQDYVGSPPANTLLQLTKIELDWLNNPLVEPTVIVPTEGSITNSPTLQATYSPTPLLQNSRYSADETSGTLPEITMERVPSVCEELSGNVDSTVNFTQGLRRDGLPVDLTRSIPSSGWNGPDGIFTALGLGGSITYAFPGSVQNIPGDDFAIYEFTFSRSIYPVESASVEISDDGISWYTLPNTAVSTNPLGISRFDIDSSGLDSFVYVRITDIPNPSNSFPDYDGFDIDAVEAFEQNCTTGTATVSFYKVDIATEEDTRLTDSNADMAPFAAKGTWQAEVTLATESAGIIYNSFSLPSDTDEPGIPVNMTVPAGASGTRYQLTEIDPDNRFSWGYCADKSDASGANWIDISPESGRQYAFGPDSANLTPLSGTLDWAVSETSSASFRLYPNQEVYCVLVNGPVEEPEPTPTVSITPTLTPTSSITPTPVIPEPIIPEACTDGSGWANEYISGSMGLQLDTLPVPGYRSNPSYAYGPPDAIWFSLGLGGNAVYGFGGVVNDQPGIDISIYEFTYLRMFYSQETAQIAVSQDGTTWLPLSQLATSRFGSTGITSLDFSETGLPWIRYVRITDIPNLSNTRPDSDGFDIDAISAVNITCDIPVEPVTGALTISKTNSSQGEEDNQILAPGSDVTYIIKVTATSGPVTNVKVYDLPPADIRYVSGSWTAVSSDLSRGTGGNLKGNPTTEPVYSSPGVWNLGTMNSGETVTLTYKGRLSTVILPGVHPDMAWVQGETVTSEPSSEVAASQPQLSSVVTGTGQNSRFVAGEFVGSEIQVQDRVLQASAVSVRVRSTTTATSSGDVLGATSNRTLPKTGTSMVVLFSSILILFTGLVVTACSLLVRKKAVPVVKQTAITLGLGCIIALFPAIAFGSTQFTAARMTEPQRNINDSSFRIPFVVMDSAGRQVQVTCYKKGPADSVFQSFASGGTLKAGGNSGSCTVSRSVMNRNGIYQFYIAAVPEGGEAVSSNTIQIEFNTDIPGTPSSYGKDKPSTCEYRIRFRTANDNGRTTRVEIYRSTSTSFTANSDTRVGNLTIGSNTNGTFTNSTPDCNRVYYYAVRAFDEFGNGSGIIADSIVTVRTTTTSTTGTSNAGSAGQTTGGGAIQTAVGNVAPPAESVVGDVQGATVSAITGTPDQNGEVQGEETNNDSFIRQNFRTIIGAILLILGTAILIYVFYKNGRFRNK